MKSVTSSTTVPQNSIISTDFPKINYCDSYRITKSTNDTVEEITAAIFNLPKWVNGLMAIRNSIVAIFGLKSDKKVKEEQTTYFTIIEQNENEIVMGENDKHLDFRTSVFVDRANSFIYLTTIVHYNNFWGRAYFFFIKPFHKIIIRSILKRQLHKTQKNEQQNL